VQQEEGVKDDRRNEQRRRGDKRKGKRRGREQMKCRGGKGRKGKKWKEREECTVGSSCTSHEQGGVANATADRRGFSPAIMAARSEQGAGAGAGTGSG
jgi:hypothetical protein